MAPVEVIPQFLRLQWKMVIQGMTHFRSQDNYTINTQVCLFVWLFFFYPEGFTILVTNEDLEKARAYLNQIPRDQRLYIPSKGCV